MARKKKLETDSHKRLAKNLRRCDGLLSIFDSPGGTRRKKGQPRTEERDLLRAVIVLSVGALDAFLSDVVVELLPEVAANSNATSVFDEVARRNPGLVLRSAFTGTLDNSLRAAVEDHFASKSMHGAKAMGLVNEWCDLQVTLATLDPDGGEATLACIEKATEQRHKIVHEGAMPKVERQYAGSVVAAIRTIGAGFESAVWARYPA